MAYIDVDIDLFDDDEIIEAAAERIESVLRITDKEKRSKRLGSISEHIDVLHQELFPEKHLLPEIGAAAKISLLDHMKIEYVMSVLDKYTLDEIEARLPLFRTDHNTGFPGKRVRVLQ